MRARVYLIAAIIGFFVPPILIGYFVADQGFDIVDLLNAAVDNTIALAVFMDVTLSSLVFWFWASGEAKEHEIRHWWWIIPANLLIGLCFALPLFLYWRERALDGSALKA